MRRSLGIAACAMVMTSMVACGSDDNGGSNGSSASESATLTLWHNSADHPALLDMYEQFEEETGHTLELVSVPADGFEEATQTKWATGERPDILEYHASRGHLISLNPTNELRALSDEEFVDRSGDLYESAASYDGQVYGVVLGFPQVFGLYYNKDVLNAAGVEPPGTFAELAQACETLQAEAPDVAPIFEAAGSFWPPQIMVLMYAAAENGGAYGTETLERSATFDEPGSPVVAGLTAYKDLQEKGCFNGDITTATFEDSMHAVVDGEAAFVAQHSDMLPTLLDAADGDQAKLDETVGFGAVSSTAPVASYAPGPIGTYYLPKTGDEAREAAALEFVRFMTGPAYEEYVQEAKVFPVLDDVPEPEGVAEVLIDVKEAYDKEADISFASNLPGTDLASLMSEMIVGQKTPEEVAAQLQKQVEQAAKAAGLPGW